MLDAYVKHRSFVASRSHAITGVYVEPWHVLRFSPFDETKIVRRGDIFRIRGWWSWVNEKTPDENAYRWHYICEMRFDEGLDVWHLSNVELIMP